MRDVLVTVAIAAALSTVGCGNAGRNSARSMAVLVNVDASGSQTDRELRQSYGAMDELVDKALPRGSRVVVWRFDDDAERQYDGCPARARDLWPVQDDILQNRRRAVIARDATPTHGCRTDLSDVLRENLGELRRIEASGQTSALLLLWDGEDAYPDRTRDLVRQLAPLKSLKAIWIVGVVTDSGQNLARQVRRVFDPVADRLVVSGLRDRRDGFQRLKRYIQ